MFINAYSFADVSATYIGPGGTITLGDGAGPSEEGISIAQADNKGTLMMGADGSGTHSLHKAQNGTVTVRLLKGSPVNNQMMTAYNIETRSASLYGQGVIVLRNAATGDVVTSLGCGWAKVPDLSYAKDSGVNEWTFNAGRIEYLLGTGTPSVI